MAKLLIAAVLAGSLLAQSSGSISGAVKDSKGGMIPGATVTVAARAEAVSQTAYTGGEGSFVFPQLPPGTYTITVEMAGFKKAVRGGVILLVINPTGGATMYFIYGEEASVTTASSVLPCAPLS